MIFLDFPIIFPDFPSHYVKLKVVFFIYFLFLEQLQKQNLNVLVNLNLSVLNSVILLVVIRCISVIKYCVFLSNKATFFYKQKILEKYGTGNANPPKLSKILSKTSSLLQSIKQWSFLKSLYFFLIVLPVNLYPQEVV